MTSVYGPSSALLVKDWSFVGLGTSGDATFTYGPGEYTDDLGAEGQGNPDPPAEFHNHFIVSFDGEYYDPSYGKGAFSSQAEWEDASLDGFSQDFLVGGDVQTFAKKNDPGAGNIETIFTPL